MICQSYIELDRSDPLFGERLKFLRNSKKQEYLVYLVADRAGGKCPNIMPIIPKIVVFFTVAAAGILFVGCFKTNTKPHNSADTSFLPDRGILYVLSDSGLQKIDASSGVRDWLCQAISGSSPLDYSSGNIYSGGLTTMAAINYQTGVINWLNLIPREPDNSGITDYCRTAFQDSLVYYTKGTGVFYGDALLYCAYQDNGQIIWTNQIDSNNYNLTSHFNGIPYVANGNVLTLTRNYYNNFQITAFDAATGRLAWNSPQNDSLTAELHVTNNYIISATSSFAYCYSSKDGSLVWQTDLQFPPFSAPNSTSTTFLDGNNLIVCRNYNGPTNLIRELNATTGQMMNTFELDVPEAYGFWEYGYNAGMLYTLNLITEGTAANSDSADVVAFDLGSRSSKWKYNYSHVSGVGMVITNNNVIVPSGINDGTGFHTQVTFLDLDGRFVKTVSYAGTVGNRLMYVDSAGVVYKQAD
ncbi:MAG TPA: PQQ-binding-like beta-propeller repeat protein [Puia sp.]|nr:PQQ-binding-like beta-propeller repeat protein [Puia sp.]